MIDTFAGWFPCAGVCAVVEATRALTLTDAIALVLGTVIGTGVFEAVIGLVLIALGLPIYGYFKQKLSRTLIPVFPEESGRMKLK